MTYCPYAWSSLSVEPDQTFRVCCNALQNRSLGILLGDVNSSSEVVNSPAAQQIRDKLVRGEWPEKCVRCQKVEEQGGFSYRKLAIDRFGSPASYTSSSEKVRLIDIALGNRCNLLCRMCSPYFSAGLAPVYRKIGLKFSQETVQRGLDFKIKGTVFDKRETWENCELLGIQGGEPFLSQEAEYLLERLIEWGLSGQIKLSLVTNCSVDPSRWFPLWERFASTELNISLDGTQRLAEYIRYPLKWDAFEKNVRLIHNAKLPNCKITFVTAVQAYNLPYLTDIFEWIRDSGVSDSAFSRPGELEYPAFLRAGLLPDPVRLESVTKVRQWIQSIWSQLPDSDRSVWNLWEGILTGFEKPQEKGWLDFVLYCQTLDRQRQQNSFELFPFLRDSYSRATTDE